MQMTTTICKFRNISVSKTILFSKQFYIFKVLFLVIFLTSRTFDITRPKVQASKDTFERFFILPDHVVGHHVSAQSHGRVQLV